MMNPEMWRQIEGIYHATLERPLEDRPTFLDEVCAGDQALRQEVESLLAYDERATRFIEAPPADIAAGMLVAEQTRSMVGRTLGHYQVHSLLGAGGMGEVYLAEDTQLGRKAALKLLPAQFTQDAERLRRFVREARAASALNHPNIITIYEIGEIGETHFIAAELVEGSTLRRRMASERLELHEALDAAIQIAAALDAAHKAGIVHRDIKPENIMLRPDGLIKVLDFGLAKLTESQATTGGPQAATIAGYSTETGVVMGTPRYMSPEQVRGQKADARTDIFSLGVVLYEMIAGSMPFEGESRSDVIAAILKSDPLPLTWHWPDVPRELEQIVEKALRKDREKRYQVIKDLQLDLKDLEEKLEFEARLAGASHLEARGRLTSAAGGRSVNGGLTREQVTRTGEGVTPGVTSPIGGIRLRWLRWRGALLALAAVIVVVAGFVLFGWRQLTIQHRQPMPPPPVKRLTSTGQAMCAAISPDGKYVVYAKDEDGLQSLQLIQVAVAADSDKQIVPPAEVDYHGITFSPDGNFIYYVTNAPDRALYRATVLGGAAKKLLDQVHSPVTFSPDGEQLAFVSRSSSSGEYILMIANRDGAEEKQLAARKHSDPFRLDGPSWSPNGELIACGAESGGYHQVVGVQVADRVTKLLTSQRWKRVGQVAWLTDGSGLLMVAAEPGGSSTQIWHLAYPGGEAHRITPDLINYAGLSLTDGSSALLTLEGDRFMNIWIAPGKDAGNARQITFGTHMKDGWRGLAWTPDGKIVYRSEAGDKSNVRIMEADGTANKILSPDTPSQNLDPAVSPDGRHIVWSSSRHGIRNIWRMDLDGSNPQQLTGGGGEWFPQYSPDGKWMVYQALDSGPHHRLLWKKPLEGGAPVQLTHRPSYAPVVSPDGKMIAFNYRSEAGAPIKMAVIPFEGGALKLFDLKGPYDRPIRWTPDGSGLAYIVTRGGVSNIWSQPFAGGPPKQLTRFDTHRIINFAWSRDGRHLALSRPGTGNDDVVLISNFR